MKVIIIEDENIAIRKFKKMLTEINSEIQIIAELESVYDAKKWFLKNSYQNVDLIFTDIQLSDGQCFEIFEDINLNLPLIFTTAYNEYALKAFKHNSIDYLLKPISKEDLSNALAKFENTKKIFSNDKLLEIRQLISNFQNLNQSFPCFLSHKKERIIPVSSELVVFFYTQNQIVYAVTETDKYILDEILEEIENRLPQSLFFRVNRQFIIQKKYVSDAEIYFNNRLILHLTCKNEEQIIVSREKTYLFKNWLKGI